MGKHKRGVVRGGMDLPSQDKTDFIADDFITDRIIDSTDTNEYAENMRDETMWEQSLIDTELPESEYIPDMTGETGEDDRPVYEESGYDKEEVKG